MIKQYNQAIPHFQCVAEDKAAFASLPFELYIN